MPEKQISCNPYDIWKNAKEIVQQSQMNLLGYFKTVLEQCFTAEGVKQGIKAMKSPKGKRRPSGYNLYIGECMKEGKAMKQCSTEWKTADKESWNQKAKGSL